MTMRLRFLPLLLGTISTSSLAASYAIEARGDAMGGVGVVSASYLTAPFYNPALTAIYRRNDDAGVILPSFGISYNDPDKLIDAFDEMASLIDAGDDPTAIAAGLEDMKGKQLKANIGGVIAIGIPNSFASMNFFGKTYAETYVVPNIDTSSSNPLTNAQNSSINAVSVAVAEVGISLAKYSTFLGQHISLGVSPKIQRVYTFVYNASFSDYSVFDAAENSTSETVFNIDAGALWFYGPIRVGFSAMNLVSRDIETKNVNGIQYQYKLKPQYTLGVGLVGDYATLSVDYDLAEESRYVGFDDNTQMIRVGGEIDIMRQLKLRAGYNKNLAYSDQDPTWTAGLGISPLGLIELDVGISYTNINAKGAFINFLSTF